jgi:hypothetical protein
MKKLTLLAAAMSVFVASVSFFAGNWQAGLGWSAAAMYQFLHYLVSDKINK